MKFWTRARILQSLAVAIFISTPFLYQNCSQGSHTSMASNSDLSVAQKAMQIRQDHCASCHQDSSGHGGPTQILNDQYLIDNVWVIPGDPENSPLYMSLASGMPQGEGPLSPADQATLASWIRDLTSDSVKPAQLVVNNGQAVNFGALSTGTSFEQAVQIQNSGGAVASDLEFSNLNPPFSFKDGAFPGTGGTCLPVIAGGTSCTVVLKVSPASAGVISDLVTLTYNDSKVSQVTTFTMSASATGTALASLQISDSPTFQFPGTTVGQVSTKVFTLSNSGSATATGLAAADVIAPFRFKGGVYPGTGGNCSTSLNVGTSCTVVVEFSPTSALQSSADLIFEYNDGAMTQHVHVNISGLGVSAGQAIYYSQVRAILNNANNCKSCHTSDWGTTYASLMAFKRAPATTPAIVAGDANSRFVLRLQGTTLGPQMGVAPRGNLSSSDRQTLINWVLQGALNDPSSGSATLTVSDGPTFDFGSLATGSVAAKTFTVTNSGTGAATSIAGTGLALPFRFKGGAFPGTGGSCSATLNGNSSCTLVLEFAPSVAGLSTDTLVVGYQDGATTKSTTRALKGTGVGAATATLTLNPASPFDFGSVAVGTSLDATFTIANVGGATASAMGLTGATLPFTFKGGTYPGTGGNCATSLAMNANCTVVLSYSPSLNGGNSASLMLNFTDAGTVKHVNLSLSGTGVGGGGGTVYYSQVRAILTAASCSQCHSMGSSYSDLLNFRYQNAAGSGPAIVAGDLNSRFIKMITTGMNGKKMGAGGGYGTLSSTQVDQIIAWIRTGAPNDPSGTVTQAFTPLVGDRYYIGSVFYKVFGTGPQSTLSLLTPRADLYGSACHYQDNVYVLNSANTPRRQKNLPFVDYCDGKSSDDAMLEGLANPAPNSIGEALRVSTCMKITTSTTFVTNALQNAGLTKASPFDQDSITKIYNQFYPSDTPSTVVWGSLKAIGDQALVNPNIQLYGGSTRQLEGWRYIILTLCQSPGWVAP